MIAYNLHLPANHLSIEPQECLLGRTDAEQQAKKTEWSTKGGMIGYIKL